MGRPGNPIDPEESLTAHYGWKIRKLREGRGWSQTDLGRKIGLSTDAVSKLELGKSAPDDRTGELLDTTYGTDYFRDHAILVRKERVPASARSLARYEETAARIYIYEPDVVTGLFQIEDYIRAFVGVGLRPDDVEEIVTERFRRQEVLDRKRPPRVVLVIDEGALWRRIGGPGVLRAQLEHLEALMARPNITIQVVPLSTGAYAGLSAGFTILALEAGGEVVHIEGPVRGTGQLIEQSDTVVRLSDRYDLIRSVASPVMETKRLLRKIQESL